MDSLSKFLNTRQSEY